MPTPRPGRITARWHLLTPSAPPRSSHSLVALPSSEASGGASVLIYGGEAHPRQPADSSPGSGWLLSLPPTASSTQRASVKQLAASSSSSAAGGAKAPVPRVGAAAVQHDGKAWLWGGRSGVEMAPLSGGDEGWWTATVEEQGEGKGASLLWEHVPSPNTDDAPVARSYHAITSLDDRLYVHAGCPEKGRLGDLHSFDVRTRTWTKLADAPGPGRGGTVLTPLSLSDGEKLLARWGGFAGHELGADNSLDLYSPISNTWTTVHPSSPSENLPGARSVHALVPYTSTTHPSVVALLVMGEKAPSSQGHAGAGEFWDDVWALTHVDVGGSEKSVDVGGTEGSIGWKEGGGVGGKSGGGGGEGRWRWEEVEVMGEKPEGRGWFAAARTKGEAGSEGRVVVHGGLVKSNQRSGGVWELYIE